MTGSLDDGDRVERVLHADRAVVERWLFAMFTTSTPAAFSAVNDAAGERKWKFFPATGSPRR